MWEPVCYALTFVAEGFTAWLYFGSVFDQKKNAGRRIMWSFALGYALLFCLSRIENVVLNGASFLIVNILLTFLNYNTKIVPGLIQNGYINIAMFGTEMLVALAMTKLSIGFEAYRDDMDVFIAFAALSRLLYFAVLQISAKIMHFDKSAVSDYSLTLLSVFPVSSIVIGFAICFVCLTTNVTGVTSTLLIIAIFILLMCNILIMVIYERIQKINNERMNYAVQIQKESDKAEYYRMMQEQANNQRVLIHDMKRHINSLSGLLRDKNYTEMEDYLESFSEDPVFVDVKLSDEPVMNLILTRYKKLCQEKRIICDFDVRHGTVASLHKDDITALFDNLLSNSFEAAKSSDNGYINLSVIKENTELLIKIENSCDVAPETDGEGRFVSNKKNKINHGIGISSIEKIVNRYAGHMSMTYSELEKCFTVIIIMQNERDK